MGSREPKHLSCPTHGAVWGTIYPDGAVDYDCGCHATPPPPALRHDAEKYAGLREAGKAYKDAVDARGALADADGVAGGEEPGELARYCIAETNAYRAMLAALAALGGEE